MKISVITVCLNSEKTVEQTIRSVISQENCDYEYIIIDGKSTDKTMEIIDRYRDRISAIVSEPDSGVYDGMNKGISLATGDIIGIINSDDWYEPGTFSLVEKCFRNTDVEVVYGKLNLVDADGKSEVLVPSDIEKIRYEMEIPHPTVFVRRDVYKKYGIFQLKYKIAADYDLMLRFYNKGVKFKYLKHILANFRKGGISLSQGENCARETLAISSKYLPFAPLEKRQSIKNIISNRRKAYLLEKMLNDSPTLLGEILKKKLGVSFEDDIVIFGAGAWGKKMYRALLGAGKEVSFLVDNDRTKWNQKEDEISVLSPDVLQTFQGIVLMAVRNFSAEISLQISRLKNPFLYCICWEEIGEIFQGIDGGGMVGVKREDVE